MIDYFTIALTHGLIALAAFRLLTRDDLDREDEAAAADTAPAPRPKGKFSPYARPNAGRSTNKDG
ncbi:hypothetical protein GCM10009127_03460 [Alteraurantiacibacter aestuarii]|uniref:hypothetical protein n=1 Tax=Alteraurantiacibacter aestuarii TaxID=650004 RepID=UPI0019279BB6